ncbi:hypothetical protein COO60DRAFT_687595 [Scenedesmus sp. NREL 46B-D3]|nr:hypothetical protein COO60DRAFT_687595 [Scenedesmus sp. NREL 46B-D3]
MRCLGLSCLGLGGSVSRRSSVASKSESAVQHAQVHTQHVAAPSRHAEGGGSHGLLTASRAASKPSTQNSTTPDSLDSGLSKAIAAAAEHLACHGWAVVAGVLTVEECQQYQQGVWDWLERLGEGVSRDDQSSWTEARGWPPSYKGIVNTLEVAHQDFVWRVRKHPRLLQVFAELYGTNELLSSFDSINLTAPGTDAAGGWLHVDHAPLKKGCQCIQGLLNMGDVGPESTGTLMVKDKSHLLLEEFYEHHVMLTPQQKAEMGNWYVFQEAELPYWQHLPSLGLAGAAGDLFLWDSRTAHQNIGPAATTAWRHVVYACYQPRALATDCDLQLKQQAWEQFLVTTHWPSHNVTVLPGLGSSASFYAADSHMPDQQETGTEQLSGCGDAADRPSADGRSAGSTSSPVEVPDADAAQQQQQQQQQQGYWDARAADGSAQALLASLRTRHRVEDASVRKLAGVQPYQPTEVWRKQPLVDSHGVLPPGPQAAR